MTCGELLARPNIMSDIQLILQKFTDGLGHLEHTPGGRAMLMFHSSASQYSAEELPKKLDPELC